MWVLPAGGTMTQPTEASTVPPMAASLSSGAKARAIADLARWLSDVEHREPNDPVAKAIDAAYNALRVSSEVTARNQVCALLSMLAQRPGEPTSERRASVRGFIAALHDSHIFGLEFTYREASNEVIDAALDAWGPTRIAKKWRATSELLQESGFPRVEPNALRKGWDRRSP